ncbi:hypothetical protein QJS04_geneDACA004221 [Acorus gramineus]|uniref:DNA-directed DNA polymerase n=1 Tax=Acorus gramineus TaxID=55184 RepID=A0AAV9B289_ACOGR|nr:hypothetical protein QJS04_geneDACA004221 [Acorus gramineus]
MTDGRRHSVDIPLSKTLVALKRVRSLRDPATNSLSKFSTFVDHMNWETNSFNADFMTLDKLSHNSDNRSLPGSDDLHPNDKEEVIGSDAELDSRMREALCDPGFSSSKKAVRVGNRGLDSRRNRKVHDSDFPTLVSDKIYENGHGCDRSCCKDLGSKNKRRCDKPLKTYGLVEEFLRSKLGSPCLSLSDANTSRSNRSMWMFANEEVDIVDTNHNGCGLTYCWSRTPRSRDNHSLPSDVEDHPLLFCEGRETDNLEEERGSTCFKRDSAQYLESPRSLSQKYRPRSFNELIGQRVVAQSLSSAVLKGKVAPIYLFHGAEGTGKTSTARIFAAALNCLSHDENRPCRFCRECSLFFSGRSRDVKELDASRINRTDRIKALLKSASLVPFSSRFKVFVIDECQFLRGEAWAAILNSLDELPQHVAFVMITSEFDKLPRNVASRCQRYHFSKIKGIDMVVRLQKICLDENLEFDEVALELVATKSNGSLRDAETMLDQLSLLGKKISVSLVYELIGVVSDDDLLDLLDLALSSDTTNTVKRARELMRSRVDPMQLIAQLANLIMDILAGRCQAGDSEVGRKFFGQHNFAEVGLPKLRNALKVLSDTEKQLRASKNQATWLTVALLQFSNSDSSQADANELKICPKNSYSREDGFRSSSSVESLKHPIHSECNYNGPHCERRQNEMDGKLGIIWQRTADICNSNSLKNFLQKEGTLSAIYINQGLAIAEIEFCHPDHVSRAEKSWKLIASALQHVLGCNVEIRIHLSSASSIKNVKVNNSCSFWNCVGRQRTKSSSSTTDGFDVTSTACFSESALKQQPCGEVPQSDHGSRFSPYVQPSEAVTIRSIEGNALSTNAVMSSGTKQDELPTGSSVEYEYLKAESTEGQDLGVESESHPGCFARAVKFPRRLFASDTACCQPKNNLVIRVPKKASSETCFCTNKCFIFCSGSDVQGVCNNSSGNVNENGPAKDLQVDSTSHCWKPPRFPVRKSCIQLGQRRRHRLQLVSCFLPCVTVKQQLHDVNKEL